MHPVKHFKTIVRHRRLVREHCRKCGIYVQGLLHDLSKFSPVEFIPGAIYFQGNRSPNAAEREDKGYTSAWLHHKGRNKHHLEYWIDYDLSPGQKMSGMKMPARYVVEMFCDRIAACKVYNGESYTDSDPLNYFKKSKDHYIIHPDTEKLLAKLLFILARYGEEKAFSYAASLVKKYGGRNDY